MKVKLSEARLDYNKGLRFLFRSYKEVVRNNEIEEVVYMKNQMIGYISAGYWSNIISEEEYHKLFSTILNIMKSGMNHVTKKKNEVDLCQ